MKRHHKLRKFSDDHHAGLVQARRLRRVAAGEGATLKTARAFLGFWEEDARKHFREEEEVLLAVYARYDGDLDAEPIREMVADHARIRGLVMRLDDEAEAGEVDLETLREVGECLEAHIRLEERRVFPLVEAFLSGKALGEIGDRLDACYVDWE